MRILSAAAVALCCAGLLMVAPPAAGDDLVRAAKKEKARREALAKDKDKKKQESKPAVLSNTQLSGGQGTLNVMGGGAAATPATPSSKGSEVSKPAKPSETAAPGDKKKDEQYWRGRVKQAKQAVEAANGRVKELEALIPSLRSESIYIDDPGQRQLKGVQLDQAIADLGKAKLEASEADNKLDAVRAEGRRAGAYPAWLR